MPLFYNSTPCELQWVKKRIDRKYKLTIKHSNLVCIIICYSLLLKWKNKEIIL